MQPFPFPPNQSQQGTSMFHSPEELTEKRVQGRLAFYGMKYGELIYRGRWGILIFWVALLLCSLPLASTVSEKLTNSGLIVNNSESSQVEQLLKQRLHQPITDLIIVLHAPDTLVTAAAYQRQIQKLVTQLRGFAHLTALTLDQSGKDHQTALLRLG